jgi:antitoxin component YwqK of YwqJK toxin-antitoxin module
MMNRKRTLIRYAAFSLLCVGIACNSNKSDDASKGSEGKRTQYALNTGVEDGMQIEKYANGNKKFEGKMKNGKRTGEWFLYFENGTLWSRCNYVDDQKQGKSVVYLPSGSKAYEGMYEKDVAIGEWIYYKEDGSIAKKVMRNK